MDYSRYPSSGKYYTGAERKKGILIKGKPYIVKYAKNSPDGMTYSHVSEYIGSHLFAQAGFDTQKTILGTCDNCEAVIIKDFIGEEETFVPFNEVGDSSLEQDRERYKYTYDDIEKMLEENTKLTDVEETSRYFWDMYIMDAWIGNFDRHGANWGFLKKNNQYRMAPIYDNGSSLFPKLNTDEKLRMVPGVFSGNGKADISISDFTDSIRWEKSSYYEVIDSLMYEKCNQALTRMHDRIELKQMEELIESMEKLSDVRREFYVTMLRERYEKLIEQPYRKLAEKEAVVWAAHMYAGIGNRVMSTHAR